MTDDERERTRQLMIKTSSPSADRSKKRKASVERYMGQFLHRKGKGGGEGKSDAYRDGWDRIFGDKS